MSSYKFGGYILQCYNNWFYF